MVLSNILENNFLSSERKIWIINSKFYFNKFLSNDLLTSDLIKINLINKKFILNIYKFIYILKEINK